MPRHVPKSIAGFTLLELLVVVLLIGIFMSLAVLSIGGDQRGEELEREAKRLVALIEYAREQAVLRTQEWGVRFEEDAYFFMLLEDDSWVNVGKDNVLHERQLPSGMNINLIVEDLAVDMAPDFDLDEDDEQTSVERPMVFILSSGETTSFSVEFRAQDTELRFRVIASMLGELSLEQ